jgi:hypothetical protein
MSEQNKLKEALTNLADSVASHFGRKFARESDREELVEKAISEISTKPELKERMG